MMNPFIELISSVIQIINLLLIVWIVLGWLIAFNIINRNQPLVYRVNDVLSRLFEPVLRPIRRILPDLGSIDISPIILFLLLQFLQRALFYYFYSYPAGV